MNLNTSIKAKRKHKFKQFKPSMLNLEIFMSDQHFSSSEVSFLHSDLMSLIRKLNLMFNKYKFKIIKTC